MISDLRFAFRQLLKSPGFTAVAVLTLALGIGANTAIFSVTNAVLFRALPYPDPDRIVSINKIESQFGLGGLTAGAFLDFREQSKAFEQLAAYSEDEFTLTGSGDAERVICAEVASALFPLLGVQPSLGRTFSADEEQVGRDQVVVVSESFWKRHAGGDPNFIGKTITLNDRAYTVIGVMPARFQFPRKFEIWKPLALDPVEERHGKQFRMIQLIGRLAPDVSLERAQAELNTIWTRRASEEPGAPATNARIEITPLHEQLVKDVRLAILVLLSAVAFVLLIACANVANLMLARATVRRKEIAIRAALGASRRRIIAQLLAESVSLSLLGGAVGLLLAVWGVDLLVASIPADVAGSFYGMAGIGIDRGVLIFTIAVSVATGIFFGLAPALSSARVDLNEALKATAKTATARSGLRGAFVIAQLALTLILLIGAGLMTRSFVRLMNVPLGFNQKNVLTFRVELPRSRYANGAQRKQFFGQLLERVKAIPGIQSAGAISQLPLSGYSMMGRFTIEGQPKPEPGKGKPIPIGMVTPDYFQAMQIPLVGGRLFDSRDVEKMPEVAIVNESMARKFWPGENPIGKKVGAMCDEQALCRTVVGVVGDVRHEGLANDSQPEIYLPHEQIALPAMSLVLRTPGNPLAHIAAVRNEVRALDKDQPIALVQTLEEHISQSILQPRLMMTLLSIFAGLALVLAAVGVYAMMSYSVSQRRGEIGIRIALGAAKADILRLVVGQAMLLVAISLTIGLAGALAATRLLGSLLYGIGIRDPSTFAGIALLLSLVSLFAAWLPARRAAKISPMTALRTE
ncbi:MAG TPA: ABC transporter permease [Chthoniobacterales bacterium]|nr:ABC transporter permease [Chthoniobacterales bacterium]